MPNLVTIDLCGCLKLENLPLLANTPMSQENIDIITISENFDISISSYDMNFLIFLDLSFCNLSTVPDAIRYLWRLERLNLEGNNFVSLPSSMSTLFSLAYLNLAHCSRLQSLPELGFCATSTSGGRYFKMVSGSHDHRSGFYIFNCPLLEIAEGHNLALSWLRKLLKVLVIAPPLEIALHCFPLPLSSVLFFTNSDIFFISIYDTRVLVISGVALTL
jgi:hypothetical protein